MIADDKLKELVRLLEEDYEKTTQAIDGVVGSSFTIRGWGIALSSALIGLVFQVGRWEIAVLAVVVTLLIALADGYHSWLYARVLTHANDIEDVMRSYYAYLARPKDEEAALDFEVKLLAHRFGRFTEIDGGFRLSSLREAQPRPVLLALYGTLLACAVVSGVLVASLTKHPAPSFGCVAAPNVADVYVCKPK